MKGGGFIPLIGTFSRDPAQIPRSDLKVPEHGSFDLGAIERLFVNRNRPFFNSFVQPGEIKQTSLEIRIGVVGIFIL